MEADACIDDLSSDSHDEAPSSQPENTPCPTAAVTAGGSEGNMRQILSAVICHTDSSSLHSVH